jgi:hypothetical protein
MFSLLLVGMFTAFFVAVLSPMLDILHEIFGGETYWKASSALAVSLIGTLLVDTYSIKEYIIKSVAGAFLGSALLAIIASLTSYKPTIVNTTRQ